MDSLEWWRRSPGVSFGSLGFSNGSPVESLGGLMAVTEVRGRLPPSCFHKNPPEGQQLAYLRSDAAGKTFWRWSHAANACLPPRCRRHWQVATRQHFQVSSESGFSCVYQENTFPTLFVLMCWGFLRCRSKSRTDLVAALTPHRNKKPQNTQT